MQELEQIIKYTFKNKKTLEEAVTHPSVKRISKKNFSYERLELLGDKVIGLIIADALLTKFPEDAEGELSKKHAFLVCKATLASIACGLKIGKYIILTSNQEADGGRLSPSIMENTLEAICGAIYKDGGFNEAKRFILEIFESKIEESNIVSTKDPKSAFQEWYQKKYKNLPSYTIIQNGTSFTAMVEINEKSFSHTANSIKEAEKGAALAVLQFYDLG